VYFETTIEEEDGGVGGNLWMRLTQPKTDAAIIPEPSALQLGVASAGVMYFRVKVEGAPAHAATAHFGVNAIHKMILIIESLKKLNKERQARISYSYAEEADPRMKGHATTINLGTIKAGDWPSTVPGTCIIECRIGWPPIEQLNNVKNQIETTINETARNDKWLSTHPPQIEWFGWRARPHELDINDPFVKLMKRNITKVTGDNPIYYGGSAGLDTRFFVHHGTPAVTFGPLAEIIHSFDERVNIDSVLKVAETIAKTIVDWCEVENTS
jgi:acetylornithine deacetylase